MVAEDSVSRPYRCSVRWDLSCARRLGTVGEVGGAARPVRSLAPDWICGLECVRARESLICLLAGSAFLLWVEGYPYKARWWLLEFCRNSSWIGGDRPTGGHYLCTRISSLEDPVDLSRLATERIRTVRGDDALRHWGYEPGLLPHRFPMDIFWRAVAESILREGRADRPYGARSAHLAGTNG